ncbi:hypothetical protein SKAU_G00166400 [Synaphobranchus kaupii]|uniref:Uncharacterized protein n=1 Tax=Synaphobranchus kaupii TaxID=118154 RepID=A0A9Q1FJI3_SYNKA|nr:hypothetical protein SKAU_G00166400 [Synaphobranchus kaupii]
MCVDKGDALLEWDGPAVTDWLESWTGTCDVVAVDGSEALMTSKEGGIGPVLWQRFSSCSVQPTTARQKYAPAASSVVLADESEHD